MLRMVLALALLCGCSSTAPKSSCAAHCDAGSVCVDGACLTVCQDDGDCQSDEACAGGACSPASPDRPRLTQIDGDGATLCPNADGSRCIAQGLRITGERLTGATFRLETGSGSIALTPRAGATDTLTELDLPADIQTGAHTLVASNQAGSSSTTFQFIQGPQGPPGSADTGAMILTKLDPVDGEGSGLDADTVDGLDAATLMPPGTVIAFAGATVPYGWLLCDGAEVSRSTYAALFAAIGVAHGAGDQSTTFHLPDLRGRFLRGLSAGSGRDPDAGARGAPQTGGNSGDAVGSLQNDQYRSHQHANSHGRVHSCGTGEAGAGDDFWTGDCSRAGTTYVQPAGGSETRPANVAVNYLIKY